MTTEPLNSHGLITIIACYCAKTIEHVLVMKRQLLVCLLQRRDTLETPHETPRLYRLADQSKR